MAYDERKYMGSVIFLIFVIVYDNDVINTAVQ